MKKGRYVYYHCTGQKGKCPEPYVREEVIEEEFTHAIGKISLPAQFVSWASKVLRENNDEDAHFREEAMARLQDQLDGVEKRLDAVYEDKFNPEIPSDVFERNFGRWQRERDRLKRCIIDFQTANPRSYVPEGIKLLELAQNAQILFEKQPPREKRRLLEFAVSNSTWKGGRLTVNYRQPFGLFATCGSVADPVANAIEEENTEMKIWLLR